VLDVAWWMAVDGWQTRPRKEIENQPYVVQVSIRSLTIVNQGAGCSLTQRRVDAENDAKVFIDVVVQYRIDLPEAPP